MGIQAPNKTVFQSLKLGWVGRDPKWECVGGGEGWAGREVRSFELTY